MSKFGTIHIDQAMTDVSIKYANGIYVAERVAPVVMVGKQSDKYHKYGKDRFRVRDDRRGPGDQARPSRWSLSNDTYYCDGHALRDYVPFEDQVNQDPALDLIVDTTEQLTDQVQLNKEVNLVTALAAAMTEVDVSSAPWNNNSNNPITAIMTQRQNIAKACGQFPNLFVVSAAVWSAIAQNTNVTGRITGAGSLEASRITPQQFAALIEVDEVIAASAVKDTANEGATASLDFVWSDLALLCVRANNPGRKTMSLAYTFKWAGALGGGAQFVRRWRDEDRLSDVVEVHEYYDQKVITTDAGKLFDGCLG